MTDRTCNAERNRERCGCTYSGCSRQGYCCDCLQFHWKHHELPGCLFPPEAEKSYDRSLENFIEVWNRKLGKR